MPEKDVSSRPSSLVPYKSRRTLLVIAGFLLLTVAATAVEIISKSHQQRPLMGNVMALGLLNINVILLVVLLLLLGRQLAKIYFEKKKSPFGAGFKTKLVTAFIALSIVPAGLLFIVASGLLTGSVKYWFGPRIEGAVLDSISIARVYKEDKTKDALHYAKVMAQRLSENKRPADIRTFSRSARDEYRLDVVAVYSRNKKMLASAGRGKFAWALSYDKILSQVLDKGSPVSAAEKMRLGEVISGAAVFKDRSGRPGGVVVASYIISPSVSANLADVSRFYKEYWNLRTFKNPLKESYLLSFMLITLVILFAALWFGLYLSRIITVPITSLAEATDTISKGDYDVKIDVVASDEIGVLVDSFKRMTRDLKFSRHRLNQANDTLSRANELLEQRRQFMETVLENVNTGVLTIDRAGRISTFNGAAQRILEMGADDAVGKNYRDIFEFHQLEEIREQIGPMAEDGSGMEKEVQLTVGRRALNLRLFVSPLKDAQGGYLGTLVVFDDMTELIRAQRAAAWKEVARRIAHEVKNPLTPIQLSAQRLRKRYLEGTGDYGNIVDECTSMIINQVEGMKNLVDEFSRFARMPECSPVPNDLHGIIDEVATLFGGAHKDIEIWREFDVNMPQLKVDKEQMKRVFLNLFDNAVTAMDGSGKVSVATAYDKRARIARITVADVGPGILPEDREKLFQPYFSKKKSGTGLGLAIVSRIVADHGGYIRVEGNNPHGAKFVIELPAGG
jgi:two-component system, NtrC family, nitrogen regulation sensor histidine kinase NtrY